MYTKMKKNPRISNILNLATAVVVVVVVAAAVAAVAVISASVAEVVIAATTVSHRRSPPQLLSHEISLMQMGALDSHHVKNFKFR